MENKKYHTRYNTMVRVMVLNATFNNISVISLLSVLLVEETGAPGENNRRNHWQHLSHNGVATTPRHQWDTYSQLLVVIDIDCTDSWKSNYHKITTTMAPIIKGSDNNIWKQWKLRYITKNDQPLLGTLIVQKMEIQII